MKRTSTFKIVMTALFAALICVATMLIHIPTPVTGGYVNLGDGFILLGAFLLSPTYSMLAAGLGSALADILPGYMTYAPGTFVIKGLMGLAAALIYRHFSKEDDTRRNLLVMLIASVAAEVIMVLGYFAYEATFLSYGMGAAASIPANIGQGAMGIIIAMILTPILLRSHEIRNLLAKFRD